MPCLVCNSPSAQHHFGATVCRACAAFFRRFVNSKRRTALKCRCDGSNAPDKCRSCRMNKCLAIGMQRDKVHHPRDPNKVPRDLKLRTFHRLFQTTRSYQALEAQRESVFRSKRDGFVNLYSLSLEYKIDAKLLWKLCESAFPEFDRLNNQDKKVLFYNFHCKWSVLEMCMFCVKRNELLKFFSPSGAETFPIREFYTEFFSAPNLNQDDVERIFKPYWTWSSEMVVRPIAMLKFEQVENMALFGILLWDAGYSNLHSDLVETCHTMRKIMCQELSAYFDEQQSSASNVFRTLDTLSLIEKAQYKWQEEFQLCSLYNMKVDEELKNLVLWERV